ncbi:MAG: hypothetical protein ACXAEI_11345 [Candidatus Hodarchaeales archaeon]|jgi:hypothetical protein
MFAKKAFQTIFGLTKTEMRSGELSKKRVKQLLDQGIATGIEIVEASQESNRQGEWLVITLQAPNHLSKQSSDQWLQLTVYGLGYDFVRKQWTEAFRFVGKTLPEAQVVDPSVLSLRDLWNEAQADVRIGLKSQKEPSSQGEFYVLLARGQMAEDDSFLVELNPE